MSSRRLISDKILVAIVTCMSIFDFRAVISGMASMALVKAVVMAAADVY